MFMQIEHIHCEGSREFVDAISPRGKYFGDYVSRTDWAFRGHSSDEFKLIPNALRAENFDLLHSTARTPAAARGEKTVVQLLAEANLLMDFYMIVDRHGLPIPENSYATRVLLGETLNILHSAAMTDNAPQSIRDFVQWPRAEFAPLLALGQHHGLLTRLLDWTRSPYVAAYFAARAGYQQDAKGANPGDIPEDKSLISVWALNCTVASVGNLYRKSGMEVMLTIVNAPRAGNPNLHSQDGMFTMIAQTAVNLNEPVDRRPLDEIVSNIDESAPMFNNAPALFHFTLSRTKGPEVLWLLAKEGITAARMFPGYDGIVMAQKERAQWRKPG